MPLDLYVSRAPSYEQVRDEHRPQKKPGLLTRLLGREPGAPITSAEFHDVMKGAPAERKEEGEYWVRHPDGGDPWCVAFWEPAGNIVLSTSYAHHRYLRNMGDMFDLGLRIAGQLRARLYEEVRGTEVTPSGIDELLAPTGSYVSFQASAWNQLVSEQLDAGKAGLEYPLATIDMVGEYFIFHIRPERAIAHEQIPALLAEAFPDKSVQGIKDNAWALVIDGPRKRGLTKVVHLDDGRWQIWPVWGFAPFAELAPTTLAVAELIFRHTGGQLTFNRRPFDDALAAEVRSRIGGLGVDFYVWSRSLPAVEVSSSLPSEP